MIVTEKFETGSGGFVWQNTLPNDTFNQVRLHVYATHHMKVGREWSGHEFANHYNRLYFVNSGTATLNIKGEEVTMLPGCLYLIPAYQLSSHKALEPLDFYWCHFQASIDDELDYFMLFDDVLTFRPENLQNVTDPFESMIKSDSKRKLTSQLNRISKLALLLIPFLQQLEHRHKSSQIKQKPLLPAIIKIHQNISNPPLIKDLAKLCNISVEHFSRKFKSDFNIAPKRYILAKQLGKAKQLLVAENSSIDSISALCGFCDLYHFSKSFKQEVGLTPTQFRREFAKPHD